MVWISIITAIWEGPSLSSIIVESAGTADSGLQASFESELCPSVAVSPGVSDRAFQTSVHHWSCGAVRVWLFILF